ncbi:MAG: hypothetical protein JW847_09510 [Candidatus Omnitrophica bacterium]|nr:hypothetical protein [Candidatus Omnitrophota bacterium]
MNNKSFVILLIIAAIMVFGVITENTLSIHGSKKSEMSTAAIDTLKVDDIKNKIQKAGIVPHDALYWKEL